MKKIKRAYRQSKDTLTYVRTFSQPDANIIYRAKRISHEDAHSILMAKQLHAHVYAAVGFIDPTDIEDDIIHSKADPHQAHATYFAAERRGKIVGVSRQIVFKGEGRHHDSFPVLKQSKIYSRALNKIESMHPHEIVEISALVKKRGESNIIPLLLYREMWRHSIKAGHTTWVMACDVRLYERLSLLFGTSLTRIGQQTPYKGGDVIPCSVNLAQAVNELQFIVKNPRRDFFKLKWHTARFMLNKANY